MPFTIRVQPEPFDPGTEITALLANRTDIGGIGCFIGTVRDTAPARPAPRPAPRSIDAMTLEHYPGMTERALARILAEAQARWPLLAATIIHRIGRLPPGAPIVLVLTASAHRQAALDATAFLIDWLKTSAPFWKQEHFTGGEDHWVTAKAEDDQATARWITNPV